MKKCFVFINAGDSGHIAGRLAEIASAPLFCADGGAELANLYGLLPELILGDFDSVSPETLSHFRGLGVEILEFPPEKDHTDLDLLLSEIRSRGFDSAEILCGTGGRMDHTLGNLFLMEKYRPLGLEITFRDEFESISLATGVHGIRGCVGCLLSLIPLTDEVMVTELRGLRYSGSAFVLRRGDTRGISNVILADECEVRIESGLAILVIGRKE